MDEDEMTPEEQTEQARREDEYWSMRGREEFRNNRFQDLLDLFIPTTTATWITSPAQILIKTSKRSASPTNSYEWRWYEEIVWAQIAWTLYDFDYWWYFKP